MNQGITIAGNLIVDIVKIVDTYPKEGMLCNILSRSQSVGGCATNTLGCISAMDKKVPLFCYGCVGDDDAGRYILNFLKKCNVDTNGINILEGEMTSFTDVMTVKSTGARTFFQARGANALFDYSDLDFDKIKKCEIFHIGYVLLLDRFDEDDSEYGTVMARALAKIQSLGVKTSIDVVSEEGERFAKVVCPCLKYCNYFIANEIEGGYVAGINPRNADNTLNIKALKASALRLMEFGVEDLVVLHSPEGGLFLTKTGDCGFVPSLRLPKGYIKGSVGAGDAFCAGILYALYKEYPIEEAMVIANAAAAANLSSEDSVSGLKSIEEIKKLVVKYQVEGSPSKFV